MKKYLLLVIILGLSIGNISGQAQDETKAVTETLEGESVFEEMADTTEQHISAAYLKLEPQVLADIDWLNYYPLDEQQTLRDDKNRFVLMWMSGAPYLKIQMDDRIVTFQGGEPWLLMAYMMGWSKYYLEHNYSSDVVECTTAAVTNVVSFYNRNRKSLQNNRHVDKYAKMLKSDTLKKYIEEKLAEPIIIQE